MLIDSILIEAYLIDRLAPLVAPMPVEPFPNVRDIRDFAENVDSALGAVTIALRRYQNASAGEHGGEFTYHPQISVFSSSLRADSTAHHGAYDVIRSIVNDLHEKKMTIGGELFTCYVESADYVGRDEDLFAYAIDTILLPKLARF